MTLALEEPVRVAPRKPDAFYSPKRIFHATTHWRCDLSVRLVPGTCMNDPFDKERVRGTGPEPVQYSGADMYVDLYGAWHSLPLLLERVLLCPYYLGPPSPEDAAKMKDEDYWRLRQLGWWQKYRKAFNNIEPEYAVNLTNEATRRMAYKLGWRPEEPETK